MIKIIIYKDYDTTDLIFNEPCYIEGLGNIYPISVKEYKEFQRYVKYLSFSKEHLNLPNEISLLAGIIVMMAGSMCKDANDLVQLNISMMNVLEELSKLFSILTKKEIKFKDLKDGYSFGDSANKVIINENNFDDLRKVALKMCLIKEPKVFKDKEVEKWYYKGIRAANRNKEETELADIISIVVQNMKYTFEYVYNLNIFQLYVLYARINNSINYETISKFRCVGEVKTKLEYNDGVIKQLYKETELGDLLMSKEELAGMVT